VHGDVKPTNILLQRAATGEVAHVYLTDFGGSLSPAMLEEIKGAGGLIGTIGYLAPEQLEGEATKAQTDVYGLAATVYECLGGQVPFKRQITQGQRPPSGAPDPLSTMRPELPQRLDGVLAKALARRPGERYATCEQLLSACSIALASEAGARAGEHAAPIAAERRPRPSLGALGPRGRRRLVYGGVAAALLVGAAAAVAAVTSSSSKPEAPIAVIEGVPSSTQLADVPMNRVTGSGSATVHLEGSRAVVQVTTQGLDGDASLVHAIHIHAGSKGVCPPASAARLHNGHLTISTTDGINYYGPPVLSLTTSGDTSVASILAFPRFLTGGNLKYTRTIVVPAHVAEAIRANDAVVIVHGLNYDGSGIYDGVLDRSDIDASVPGTATAPALCGRLQGPASAQTAIPHEDDSARGYRGEAKGSVYTASLKVNDGVTLAEKLLCSPPPGAGPGAAQTPEAPGDRPRRGAAQTTI
jgi:hypothetical protein